MNIETIHNEIERYRIHSDDKKKTISKNTINTYYRLVKKHIDTWTYIQLLTNNKISHFKK